MAIDFTKGQAVSIASSQLRKVAGNLPGLLGLNKGKTKLDSSDTASLNQKSQNSPNLFQFPLDIAGDPGIGNHGHYIIFFINEQQNAKLSFTGSVKDGKDSVVKEKERREIPSFIKSNFGGKEGYKRKENVEGEDQLISKGSTDGKPLTQGFNLLDRTRKELRQKPQKEGGQNVSLKRPATKRLDTAIAMYMPASTQVTYAADYTESEISAAVSAAYNAYQGVRGGQGVIDTLIAQVPKLKEQFAQNFIRKAADAVDALGVSGARTAIEIATGEIVTDRMELAFKGVGRRAFQYTFKMIPRNSREAEEIRKIVFAFKANMLPEFTKGRNRNTMSIPNTFNIQYMYKGKENDFIHRVSECFLDNVQVQYGGDRYKTFEPHSNDGAPPVETTMTLSFKEIEIMSRERIFEGY